MSYIKPENGVLTGDIALTWKTVLIENTILTVNTKEIPC